MHIIKDHIWSHWAFLTRRTGNWPDTLQRLNKQKVNWYLSMLSTVTAVLGDLVFITTWWCAMVRSIAENTLLALVAPSSFSIRDSRCFLEKVTLFNDLYAMMICWPWSLFWLTGPGFQKGYKVYGVWYPSIRWTFKLVNFSQSLELLQLLTIWDKIWMIYDQKEWSVYFE